MLTKICQPGKLLGIKHVASVGIENDLSTDRTQENIKCHCLAELIVTNVCLDLLVCYWILYWDIYTKKVKNSDFLGEKKMNKLFFYECKKIRNFSFNFFQIHV